MYLAIDLHGKYWLFSDIKASAQSSTFIEEQFEYYDYYHFNPSTEYFIENNCILGKKNLTIDSKILLELPNDYTYKQFVQDYPEMLL